MVNGYSLTNNALGSTVVIIDDTANAIVNRIEYDMLGNIKNETTTPQVELLFRKRPYLSTADLYIDRSGLYFPQTGNEGVPCLADSSYRSGSGSECTVGYMDPHGIWVPAEGCDEGQYCNYGVCHPIPPDDWSGDGVEIGWHECGSLGEVDATGRSVPIHLGGSSWGAMKPDTIGTGNSIYIPSGWDVVYNNGEGLGESDFINWIGGLTGIGWGSFSIGSAVLGGSSGLVAGLSIGGGIFGVVGGAGILIVWYAFSVDQVYRNEECTLA